ncbi:MAG: NACHT domain-containing protein [Epsilonproteobacteria bacterium]|nr:NACHT domain-containing protein [Campylobacterota bacterium]
MKEFLHNLDGKYKVATLAIFTILLLTLIGLIVSDGTQLILLASALITIMFVTVLVLLNKTKNSIRYFSLFILFTTALSLLPPVANPLMKFINAFIKSYFPNYATQQPVGEISSLVHFGTLIILLLGVFFVNYFMAKEDSTAMKIHSRLSNLSKILDMDFILKMVNISKAFSDDIERLDRQLDWSSHYFTPLDAEVLIKTEKDDKRKILDLLIAIKSSKDRLFLLLGEPGSGKSVALRKLAKELSDETKVTGKIPIYINLKEWNFEKNRTLTVEDLKTFIISYIKRGSDPIIKHFFFKEIDDKETIFDKLHEYGHIYYLFDSFDEIPQVINSKENTKLIANLSEVLNIFLTGARTEESQGIVASRLYKKPSREFLAKTVLEIRPFNESKIIQTLENIGYRQDGLIKKLFTTRPDLVQIAKNPFSAMLIAKYAEKHQHQLPKNQSELFSVFIENSFS